MRETEAQKKATRKYIASQYRPSVYIDRESKEDIEKHFASKGYKSFNEYVIALIDADMSKEQCLCSTDILGNLFV